MENQATERPIRRIRRKKLRLLLAEGGGPKGVALAADSTDTHLTAIEKGRREVGDELATKLEAAFHKPFGWMDLDDEQVASSEPVVDLFAALRYLSDALVRVDSLDRGMASHLLSELATNPGGVGTVAVKLARLLGEKARPPVSSTRVNSWAEKAANLKEARPMGSTFSNFTAMEDERPSQGQMESGDEK